MRKIFLFLLTLHLIACNNKIEDRQIFIDEFNWRITVPDEFEYMSDKEIQTLRNKGLTVLEEELGEEIVDQVNIIFWIKNGDLNSLEANYQPYDIAEDGDYQETNDYINEVTISSLTSKYPQIEVDSLSSFERIDNLNFQKFYSKFSYPNGMVLYTYSYSHLFGNQDFTVSITYTDEEIGKKLLQSWRKSKFLRE